MLSPASLRLCCLAVMAPALTKADRRADCLPVVLTDPFCNSKTAVSYDRKGKINEFAIAKLPNKLAILLNKRKTSMHKAWLRTCMRNSAELSIKTRFTTFDLQRSLLNSKVKVDAETKTWHGTSVTLAVADKVRLKYTMSKNNTSIRNMGLARANTSLGLQSMKKLNRITQFSPRDKGNNSSRDHGESLPDLPDSTNSELETALPIERHGKSLLISEQSCGDVSSSCIDLVSCFGSQQESVLNSKNVSHMSPTDVDSKTEVALESCSAQTLSDVHISISRNSDQPLPVTLTDPECLSNTTRSADEAETESNDAPCPSNSFTLPSAMGVVSLFDDASDNAISSNPSAYSMPVTVSKTTASVLQSESSASMDYTVSNSSALNCDISAMPSAFDETGSSFFVTFPDSFLATSNLPLVKLGVLNSLATEVTQPPCGEDVDLLPMNIQTCCPIASEDLSSLQDMVLKCERKVNLALDQAKIMLRKFMVVHAGTQIGRLVESCQKRLDISCQRQFKPSCLRATKDMVDLKAELLQKEDVKCLSTAALVDLVRKLETTASPVNFLPPSPSQTSAEIPSTEVEVVEPHLEEFSDVKHTSAALLETAKSIFAFVDPNLTESSENEDSEDEDEDSSIEYTVQKRVLWKYLTERASLTSRSTWLIARIHELENQLRTVTGIFKKVGSSHEDLSFEEQILSKRSAFSTAGSGDARLQTSLKHMKPYTLLGTVNGYLNDFGHLNEETCSRSRSLDSSSFHKRKLLFTSGLHLTNSKLAKLSNVICECSGQEEMLPCVLCTGRYNCAQSVDPDAMPLLDRVALLDSNFHPLLSFEKDIPMCIHFESILKKNETQYQIVRPESPVPIHRPLQFSIKSSHFSDARSRSRKLNRYARTLLSAKYRNKKHLRKHKLIFGKWRRLQNKSFHARERDRIRRYSVASSGSSRDSPVPSPMSLGDDGSGFDRRRDDNQFDIDDVIIPYSNKRGRLVKFEFKDIVIPNWRCRYFSNLDPVEDEVREEDISEEFCVNRHELCEIEEKKILRKAATGALVGFSSLHKRSRRQHRSDSRADSSGANTPDPVLLYDQDIMFHDRQEPMVASSPLSPTMSPPTTPSSANIVSDDSQPAFGNSRGTSVERRKLVAKRLIEEMPRVPSVEWDDVPPYESLTFPLSDSTYDNLLAMSDHNREDTDVTVSGPSCPASPTTSTSTSTVDEDDDPEWTVVRRESELVLKLAKR